MDNTAITVDESDFELLTVYASTGDAGAFRRLVERHIDFVYACAVRQVGNRDLAEDVVQAVFLLLSQKGSKIKAGTFIKGWLFNATRYAASNAWRAEARRKNREREAAVMRPEAAVSGQWGQIRPVLDEALGRLGTKDRTAILMRFFEDMPMVAVGSAMGISEAAAVKRVSRAVGRLRSILARRGIEVANDAMAGVLGMGLMEKAPAHLIAAACDMGTKAAAAHGGVARALTNTASRQMLRGKISVVAAKFVLAAACVGTAATVAVEKARLPAGKTGVILADASAPAAPATQSSGADYLACQQVLQAISDAYDNEDPSAANAQLYIGPDADPLLVRYEPGLFDIDIAQFRVQKAAVAKFGVHAITLNTFGYTLAVQLDELLARIGPNDYQLSRDTLVINPPAPFLSHNDAWPKSPLYFHKIGKDWKLDAGRTFKIIVVAKLRIPKPGESRDQTAMDYLKACTAVYNSIADDIEQNNISSASEVQKRMDRFLVDFSKQYSEFGIDIGPKEMPSTGNHL
jgi:RNA polymerase sigma factor (sigma-70 family)